MRKKSIVILSSLLFLSFGISSYAMTGEVIVSATRIREEANTTSEIVDTIYQNDRVEIIGDNGDWYQVKSGNNTGYTKKEFLKVVTEETVPDKTEPKESNEEESSTESTVEKAEVTATQTETEESVQASENVTLTNNVDLRNSPTLISRKFTTLEAGKIVQKLGEVGNWIQVTDGSVVGWTTKQRLAGPLPEVKTEEKNESVAKTEPEESKTEETKKEEKVEEKVKEEEKKDEKKDENSTASLSKKGIVTVGTALVREGAGKKFESINTLSKDDIVTIVAEEGDWYKITMGSISGYVNKSLIDVNNVSSRSLTVNRAEGGTTETPDSTAVDDTQVPAEKNTAVNNVVQRETIPVAAVSGRGSEVINFAKQYLGYRYVSAGKRPETGFDCSGFTQYVFSNFGVSLGGSAASQSSNGTPIDRANLQAGDLLLFYDEGYTKIGHVGIYIGDGTFIHSANPSRGVVIDSLSSSYYNPRYVGARRLV